MVDNAFLSWCDQHGVVSHHVVPGYVTEGWRGIIATEHIQQDSVTMTVPDQLLMSVISARKDLQLAAVVERHQLSSHQILCIHLLDEASKGPASFWYPYIRQLPQQYTTFLNWSPTAVEALQLQYAQEAAAAAVTKARGEWAAARPVLQELGLAKKWLSWRAWCWSSSCVLSRTMYHPDDPPTGCLTPLADLHNYQPPPAPHEVTLVQTAQQLVAGITGQHADTDAGQLVVDVQSSSGSVNGLCGDGFFAAKENVYKIVARRRYQAGDQVFLCYGRHNNLDLLELYGFLLDSNPHDTALLPVETLTTCMQQLLQQRHKQQQGEGRQWKRQQQQQQPVAVNMDVSAADCWVSANGTPSWQLMLALRQSAATSSELKQFGHLAHEGRPISLNSEQLVLKCLESACQQVLQTLETTVEQDELLVQQFRATQTMKAAGSDAEAKAALTASDTCSCRVVGNGNQGQQQVEKQDEQQQQVKECDMLAVRWRLGYKVSVNKCMQQCRTARALLSKCSVTAAVCNGQMYFKSVIRCSATYNMPFEGRQPSSECRTLDCRTVRDGSEERLVALAEKLSQWVTESEPCCYMTVDSLMLH